MMACLGVVNATKLRQSIIESLLTCNPVTPWMFQKPFRLNSIQKKSATVAQFILAV
jgi:hypothetical protein